MGDDFFMFTGLMASSYIFFNSIKRSPSKFFQRTELFITAYAWFCLGWGAKRWEVKNREIENKWRR